MENSSVCVADFMGSCHHYGSIEPTIKMAWSHYTSYWAFWFPTERKVKFGGDWHKVPEMPTGIEEPSEEEVYKWAGSPCHEEE